MTTTRRRFIQNIGMATVAAVSLNSTVNIFGQSSKTDKLILPPETLSDPLNYLMSGHFQSVVDTPVRVYTNRRSYVQLQLIEVKELKREVNENRGYNGESFSLLFQAPQRTKLSQKTYLLSHDNLGEFSLFLAPVGSRGDKYEAIINRIDR